MTISDKDYFDSRFAAMDAHLAETRQMMQTLIDARFTELRAELHKTIAATVKWCAGIVATGLLLYTTLLAFLMNNAVPRAAPAPVQYIAVPLGVPALPPAAPAPVK